MTKTQVKRVKRRLCPSDECTCGNDFGERGPHYSRDMDYAMHNYDDFEVWIAD